MKTAEEVPVKGDMVFWLANRMDRFSERLRRKIARLDARVTELERRGRS